MSKPGWGYHWTPCNGSGGGGGGWAAVLVIGAAVLAAAVAKPAARTAGQVGHAVLRGLEVAGVVVGCVLGLAVVYGLLRVTLWAYRWQRRRQAAAQQAVALTRGQPTLEAPQPPLEGIIIGTRERTSHERDA